MSGDDEIRNGGFDDEPDGEQAFMAHEPEDMLAGEEAGARTLAGVAPGDEDLSLAELGPEPPPPSRAEAELRGLDPAGAAPGEFVADAGTADIGIPDEDAADELVADDADAAEWAALDGRAVGNGAYPAAEPGADEAGWEDVEARLERLERVQREVVRTAREHEAARVRRKGRRLDDGRRRGRLHPDPAAARQRAQPLARGRGHGVERRRGARRAGRRLPDARPPAGAAARARDRPGRSAARAGAGAPRARLTSIWAIA